jgi:oligosaccharide repeat unit polymerase
MLRAETDCSLYWLVSFVGVYISLYSIVKIGLIQDGSLFENLRASHTREGNSILLTAHLSLFSLVLAQYYAYQKRGCLTLLALSFSLLGSLVFAERTSILMKISAVYYVWVWVSGLKMKTAVFAIVALFSLLVIVAIGAGKSGGSGKEYFLVTYAGFGLTAFVIWVFGHEAVQCYSSVFGNVIGRVIDILAVSEQSCETFQGAPSGKFNVYTYIANPYLLFGEIGVYCVMFVLGGLYSVLYNYALVKRGFFILMTGVMVYPLIMVFFAWTFHLTTYFYMFFILIPLFVKSSNLKT